MVLQTSWLFDNIDVDCEKGCYVLDGHENYGFLHRTGYRYIALVPKGEKRPKIQQVHRMIWQEHHKKLIPEGHVIDHLNRDPGCNDVKNLEAVTVQENNKRSAKHRDYTQVLKKMKHPIAVRAKCDKNGFTKEYGSLYQAGKDLNINPGTIAYNLKKDSYVNRCRNRSDDSWWRFEVIV